MLLAKLKMASKEGSDALEPEATLQNSKQLAGVLSRIQENLSKSLSKNDSLLEAIESSEVRATHSGSNEVATP